jgi:hypothetical protein
MSRLLSLVAPYGKPSARREGSRRNRRRPTLEVLEDRTAPAGFSFTDFSDAGTLNLIGGDASITADHRLRLTADAGSQFLHGTIGGAAWYAAEKSLVAGGFETTFQFQLGSSAGGTGWDGFAFVIQNSSALELRGGEFKLGYHGLPNSVAVEFDTNLDSHLGDPGPDHISVHTGGAGANSVDESYSLGSYNVQGIVLDDAEPHSAKIAYTPGSLSVYLDDLTTPVLTVAIDLAATLDLDLGRAWVGFTAGTRLQVANEPLDQDILNWAFEANDQIILADSPATLEGGPGSTALLTFTVHRIGDLAGEAVVNWTTSNGTASAGTDYVATSGQVTFADGQSQHAVQVLVSGDSTAESHESFRLALTTSASYVAVAGKGTIRNDDVTMSVSDDAVAEGEQGYRFTDVFVASGDGGLDHPRSVVFGPDGNFYVGHLPFSVVLRFDGESGQFIDFFGDGRSDSYPAAQVLFHQGNLFVATNPTILRFDALTGAPRPAPGKTGARFATPRDQGVARGTHALAFGPDGHLYLTSQWANEILKYDGTTGEFLGVYVSAGSGGVDTPDALFFGPDGHLYVGSSGNGAVLRFQGPLGSDPGAFIDTFVAPSSGGLTWIPHGGLGFAPDGDLYVSSRDSDSVLRFDRSTGAFVETVVSPGEGGLDGTGGHTFDSQRRLYVTSQNTDEVLRYAPAINAVFTVTLSHPSAVPVTVNYSTANGTALAGSDYTAVSGTVTFAPGETTKTVLVPTLDNTIYEGTETFALNLSDPSAGATIADAQGIATITDNDPQPTKFYVVNDATTNLTYEYGATGAAVENYALNSGNLAPRGAASSAAGDKVWVLDANKKVYIYNPSGGLLGSWTAGSLASNATPEGIATNGTDVWIVDSKSDKVFKYTGAASRLSDSQSAASSFKLNSGNTNPKGIVTDGVHLWVVNDSSIDKVFKYTLAGALVGSWTISGGGGAPTGITLDPTDVRHLWIVDNGNDRVFQYDNAASLSSGSLAASFSFALAPGNTNPQDIADPPSNSGAEEPSGTLSPQARNRRLLAADRSSLKARDAAFASLDASDLTSAEESNPIGGKRRRK